MAHGVTQEAALGSAQDAIECLVGILAEGIGFGNVGEFHSHGSVGMAFQGDRVSPPGVSSIPGQGLS
jgi:hypothetical protein